MKKIVLLLCSVSAPCLAAQAPPAHHLPSVFVTAKSSYSAAALPVMIGIGAPAVIGNAGDSGRDINYFIRKRCHAVVTVKAQAEADFVLAPNGKAWELKDKRGAMVFSTSAWREINTAKDVCQYFKAAP